ncbi:MAG: sigma-70 family RNA polymerase sigma factor [Kangiellaceae bacterium]|nr:sigma-70 family RNA polymerase sigma factor [Kangiellaceae bacterium]
MDKRIYEKYFEDSLSEYNPAILRVVSSYENIKSLQEELYQEISVALWKALSKFDQKSSLKTYILSIAHKRSISHVAKYAKEPRSKEIDEYDLPRSNCPSDQLASQQRVNSLLNALAKMSLVERQLVTLALEGVSYLDIAEILGMTTNLVGVKLNRAKLKLKSLMVVPD